MNNLKTVFSFVILFVFVVACSAESGGNSNFNNLIIPEYVEREEDFPDFSNYLEEDNYINEKIVFSYRFLCEEKLREARPYMISEPLLELLDNNTDINNSTLKSLFLLKDKFLLSDYHPMADYWDSYSYIKLGNEIWGESNFAANGDGLLASHVYSYSASVISDNGIYQLYLSYYDIDLEIPRQSNIYFEKRGEEFYWKSLEHRVQFFTDLNEDQDTIPSPLYQLKDAWNQVERSIVEVLETKQTIE